MIPMQKEHDAMFHWLSFLTYAVVTTVTPGPNTIASMSGGSKNGYRKTLPFNFGVLAGVSVIMALCALFCSLLSSVLPKIRFPMLVIGAAYILYLAFMTWRGGAVSEGEAPGGGFLSAVLLQFLNVKLILYGIVSMETYILPYYQGNIPALLGFSLLMAVFCFAATLLWSAFGTAFKWLFAKHSKTVNLIMALLLVYCAVSLFL